MNTDKIARVLWQEGQTLLPEHFRAQESALAAEVRRYAAFAGQPVVGIAELAFDPVLLAKGTVSLSRLGAVLPGGHLVEIPGNAHATPLALEDKERQRVTVYLHLVAPPDTGGEPPSPDEDEETPQVLRARHWLLLSAESAVDYAVSSLKLACFTREAKGDWRLSPEQLPPLLQVGSHPYLEGLFTELDGLLQQAQGQLSTALREKLVRDDQLACARRTLCEVRQLQLLRQDMDDGARPTAYQFIQALRRLYFEMCCYLETEPAKALPSHQHDAPGPEFARWLELLSKGFRPRVSPRSFSAFDCREGHFTLALEPLALEPSEPHDFYVLVRRADPDKARSMEGVKLASPLRLPAVRRQALKGVPYRAVPYPSFPHSFDADFDWYQLTPDSDEWRSVLRDGGLTFFMTPALEGAQVLLVWRGA